MGVVLRAWDERGQRLVALKTLLPEVADDETLVKRFKREAIALQRVPHPAIPRIHDVGDARGTPYIAMELVDGTTLERAVLEGLPLRRAIEVLRDVARALHVAHGHEVIHRDLKPANVMIGRDGRTFVMDFGLAKLLDARSKLTQSREGMGTPAYMPPEQIATAATVDPRSDVYSLGATLYFVLAKRPPFEGESSHAILRDMLTRAPDPPSIDHPEAKGDLERICLKCLEKERVDRYPTSEAVALELERWLAGQAVEGRTVGRIERLRRRVRAHARALAVAGGATLAVLGGVALVVHERARAQETRWRAAVGEAVRDADALVASAAAVSSLQDRRADLDRALERLRAGEREAATPERRHVLEALDVRARRRRIEGLVAALRPLPEEDRRELEASLAAALDAAPARLDVRLALAKVRADRGAPDEAAAVLAAHESELPAAELEHLGALRLELDDVGEARAALERAVALEPDRTSAQVLLLHALARAGDPQARARALAVTRSRPHDAALALAAAACAISSDAGLAVHEARAEERAAPRDPGVAREVGEILLAVARPEEARGALERALALSPADARCRVGLAEARLLRGEPREAASELERAAGLLPEGSFRQARVRARAARVRVLAGEPPGVTPRGPADADDDAARLLAASRVAAVLADRFGLAADRARADALLGLALRASGGTGEPAIERTRRAELATTPPEPKPDVGALIARGQQLLQTAQLGGPDGAWRVLARAALVDPGRAGDGLDEYDDLSRQLDLEEQARAIEVEDGTPPSFEALWTATDIRCVAIEKGFAKPPTIAAARLGLERVIARDPAAIAALFGRGILHAIEGESELALEDLERLRPYHPRDGFVAFYSALAEVRLGRVDQARRDLALARGEPWYARRLAAHPELAAAARR